MTSLGDRLVKKGCRNLGGTAQFTSNSIQRHGWIEVLGNWRGSEGTGAQANSTLKSLFEAIAMTSHNRTELLKVR